MRERTVRGKQVSFAHCIGGGRARRGVCDMDGDVGVLWKGTCQYQKGI